MGRAPTIWHSIRSISHHHLSVRRSTDVRARKRWRALVCGWGEHDPDRNRALDPAGGDCGTAIDTIGLPAFAVGLTRPLFSGRVIRLRRCHRVHQACIERRKVRYIQVRDVWKRPGKIAGDPWACPIGLIGNDAH